MYLVRRDWLDAIGRLIHEPRIPFRAVLRSVVTGTHLFAPRGPYSMLELRYQLFTQERRSWFIGRRASDTGFAIIVFLGHKSAVPKSFQ
jgi:hypothetical protein